MGLKKDKVASFAKGRSMAKVGLKSVSDVNSNAILYFNMAGSLHFISIIFILLAKAFLYFYDPHEH